MRHIDYATKKRFLIIPFSKKEVISYQAEKKFTSELLPKLMDHVGWIGAYLKHFFITSWREYKKQFLGDLSEFLEFGRIALINAYEFVELPLPDWIKEPVDLGEIKDDEEPVGMLAWRTFVEDVNNKARSHKDLLSMPFMERFHILAERNDLPTYLWTDGQVVYITKGLKKRMEELHGVKLDYSLSDLAEEMGINHGRKMVKGKKLTVLWATFEKISEKIGELSLEMSKMSDQKSTDDNGENEHGQSGHFDENVQNVHEEKSINWKGEDGGQSGHLEEKHINSIVEEAKRILTAEKLPLTPEHAIKAIMMIHKQPMHAVDLEKTLKMFGFTDAKNVIEMELKSGLLIETPDGTLDVAKKLNISNQGFKRIFLDFLKSNSNEASYQEIFERFHYVPEVLIEHVLEEMRMNGDIFEPKPGMLRLTP